MPERRNPMTTLNRIYAYFERLLARHGTNGNSCDWVELDRAPDLDLLQQAASAISRKHAAIQAASTFGGLKGWTWTRNPDAEPEIRYRRVAGRCPPDVTDKLVPQNVWGEALDHENGPPWRIHVTEFDDVTILQSVTSHIYTCGKSASLITVQLLRFYDAIVRGERPDDRPIEVESRANAPLFLPDWTAWDHVRSFLATGADMFREIFTAPMRLAGNKTGTADRGQTRVRFVDLGPDLWQHLRRFARDEEISRHPFYIAAWVETLTNFNAARGNEYPFDPNSKVKFVDNFSLRPYADQNLDGFYDLCAVPYAIEVPAGPSSPEKRRSISAMVERLRSGKVLDDLTRFAFYHRAIALIPKVFATKLVLKSVVKSPFILSNIGPLPEGMLDPGALGVRRYYSFPQLFPPGKIMLIITSTPDTVRAVFLWDEDAISEADMMNEMIPGFRAALARSIGFDDQRHALKTAAE